MKNKLLLFAGTTEGRELATFLERCGQPCHVCVATEYGESILAGSAHTIHQGRLDEKEMAALMQSLQITHVVDATHPYAVAVSKNIREAAKQTGAFYIRLAREAEGSREARGESSKETTAVEKALKGTAAVEKASKETAEHTGTAAGHEECKKNLPASKMQAQGVVWASSVEEAADFLSGRDGNILAATGSKELAKYTRIEGWQERVYARVLSTPESVLSCKEIGFEGKHLICMQGPFTEELNTAMLRQVEARWMVTKESGKAGGFPEKVRAAQQAGATLVVVGRPDPAWEREGSSLRQVCEQLCREFSLAPSRKITLAGIGMGTEHGMTREAWRSCEEADVLIGAKRMLQAASALGKETLVEYLPEKITNWLASHPSYEKAVVLLSGDVGFYSGARKLLDLLKDRLPHAKVESLCGISSVACLCARAGVPWEDVRLVSLHGRSQNLVAAVAESPKVFVLVGKQESLHEMCRDLIRFGFSSVHLTIGCDLSYPQERIFRGSPEQALSFEAGDLSAVLIENPEAGRSVCHGLEDSAFERTTVPMTKSEVRSISLSRLQLYKNSIVYDVGAGTGSVSVEAALLASEGRVYAVERKEEAAALIRKNALRLKAANLEVVQGLAPEALQDLPAPTHAFIGGSAGNMKEILTLLLEKNAGIRIVINAIALETVAESISCLNELPVKEVDITCVTVARARSVASYHMMMGQNPVYVISCTGAGKNPIHDKK